MENERSNWRAVAACRGADAEPMFAESAQQKRAKVVCNQCPVRLACLAEALDERVEFGVWGGMTERERRALRRRRPDVTSWKHALERARSARSVQSR
ncbi:WhiB family transcriptional regulator [Streptomyces sp. NBC_01465]|uniref:WhiB family transcriptional regulator n=1 Tax=Streptomyces sp. NBC_01465 TaxID=2903878 RepID=UPI002E332FD4|nr:WhiB family transcriptional regulator [Streptomyces sp. NBC_01465]